MQIINKTHHYLKHAINFTILKIIYKIVIYKITIKILCSLNNNNNKILIKKVNICNNIKIMGLSMKEGICHCKIITELEKNTLSLSIFKINKKKTMKKIKIVMIKLINKILFKIVLNFQN